MGEKERKRARKIREVWMGLEMECVWVFYVQ